MEAELPLRKSISGYMDFPALWCCSCYLHPKGLVSQILTRTLAHSGHITKPSQANTKDGLLMNSVHLAKVADLSKMLEPLRDDFLTVCFH